MNLQTHQDAKGFYGHILDQFKGNITEGFI